jgi:hypothetical protein
MEAERRHAMEALTFWKLVTMDRADLIVELTDSLRTRGIRFAVIGGQAVNAYVEPLVSLDLDLAVVADDLSQVEALASERYRVERFPHSLNISHPDSQVRVQIQTDPRYGPFVERSAEREVLGLLLPVADLRDVLQDKVWAALDPSRRPSQRAKDRLDILRLTEAFPELATLVPAELRVDLG